MSADQAVDLIEPYPVEDEFCFELVRIEDLGDNLRFVLASPGVRYEGGDRPIRVVKKKIVMPCVNVRPGVNLTLSFLARKAAQVAGDRLLSASIAAGDKILRLVKS